MREKTKRFYKFGSFRLSPDDRLLLRDEQPVPLTPKAIETLLLLVENAGQLVDKDELMRRVWPETFVEEGNLTKNIFTLRKALGRDEAGQEYIQTLPKRGYRFAVAVEHTSAAAVEAASLQLATAPRRTFVVAGTVVILLLAIAGWITFWIGRSSGRSSGHPIRSLAVLPFENLSREPAQDYFADGMTDELIARLSQITALRVISRTSVMQYRGVRKPLSQIARDLQVDGIVEGSVLQSGDRVRITAQLIQAAADTHLWAQSYEGSLRDTLRLQNQVSSAIASQISIKLTTRERIALSTSVVVDPDAHASYLKGRYLLNQRTPEALAKSINYFDEAIRTDSNYALAYAGLAEAWGVLSDHGVLAPKHAFPKAKDAAMKALALDPDLAEAHNALAWTEWSYDWDRPYAEQEFQRAIALNPAYAGAHQWYSTLLSAEGRFDAALHEARQALETDPIGLAVNSNLGDILYDGRHYDEAIGQYSKTLDLYPNAGGALQCLALTYLVKGMYPEFVSASSRWLAIEGQRDYRQILKALIDRAIATRRSGYESGVWIAILYARLGDADQAVAWLETAYRERDNHMCFLRREPAFDNLDSDPRFTKLLKQVGVNK